ncbi:HIRAN domain-containing protein [Kaistia defluvii]|uniref:HIRAN domain-containing protein n=1 Tax=Kaistia defluvii TaxID=410841 RepID=A0ABV2R2I9_9HYPH
MDAKYRLSGNPIPEGFRIYLDRLPVMGLQQRKRDAAAFCGAQGPELSLEREPSSRHDANAIKVIGSWKGWFGRKRRQLGYVPAEHAAKLISLGLAENVHSRLLKTYLGTDGFVEIEFQIVGPKDLYRTFNPLKPSKALSPEESTAADDAALARLDALITFLKEAKKPSSQHLEKLRRAQSELTTSRMFENGETYGQASGAPAFLNLPEVDFRNHLRSIDNDLSAQIDIVDTACRSYFETGEVPAPYYPWRIAVILSKRKLKDREREFLAAWCRHFTSGSGERYVALAERARKLGVHV